jgi:hypothetical protein
VTVIELVTGPRLHFSEWPDDRVPRQAAGVYTIWRNDQFVYVGMSGRGAREEDFVADASRPGKPKGLWTRLNSHASGRRSGDQFNVYICDRFVIPTLNPDQLAQVGQGRLLLDQLTRTFIRNELDYRFILLENGTAALAVEREIRSGCLAAGRPYLNPA